MRSRTDVTCAITGNDQPASNFFDRSFNGTAKKVLQGEYHVTGEEAMLATILGSCVSVCLYDRSRKIGGMNHFMLPGNDQSAGSGSSSARYGACAMDRLFHQLLLLGADPKALEAKVVGAGRIINGMQDIGKRNAEFAIDYLQARNVPIAAVEVGDIYPRKVLFVPATGQLFVKQLREQRCLALNDGPVFSQRGE